MFKVGDEVIRIHKDFVGFGSNRSFHIGDIDVITKIKRVNYLCFGKSDFGYNIRNFEPVNITAEDYNKKCLKSEIK